MRVVLVLLPGVIHRMTILGHKSHRELFLRAEQVFKNRAQLPGLFHGVTFVSVFSVSNQKDTL